MTTTGPLTAEEIAAVRKPYRAASLLPGRAYHDPAIHDFERQEWFRREWMVVGREEDAPTPGTYFLATVDDEPLLIARGRDGELRAFFNVCRHRGTAVVEEPCGSAVRFQCPYHAWIYDLDGWLIRAKHTDDLDDFDLNDFGLVAVRMETWQGFVFVCLSRRRRRSSSGWATCRPTSPGSTSPGCASRTPSLRGRHELEVHRRELQRVLPLPGHPPAAQQADALRPRWRLRPDRAVAGRLDGARRNAETMAIDGGHRGGRPAIPGMTPIDERRIYYYLVWPMTFLSIHPDYLLVHRLEPAGPAHTRIICQWLFEPDTIAAPGFDPSDAIAFWDLTNRQDWHVCELQQRGTRSQSWTAGRYSNQEPSVHAFDLMAVDRYANDGMNSQRTVRLRYDVPRRRTASRDFEGDMAGVRLPRATPDTATRAAARAKAAARTEGRGPPEGAARRTSSAAPPRAAGRGSRST